MATVTRLGQGLVQVIIAALLVACGGGGDDDSGPIQPPSPAIPTAEGLWKGTTSAGRTVRTLVLDDGSFWSLYSAVNSPGITSGMVHGVGSATGSSFSSPSARDFNVEAATVTDATLSASFAPQRSFNGSLNYQAPTTSVTFTGVYDAAYEQAPLLTNLTGTYAGTASTRSGTETVTLTVSATGMVLGTSSDGCQFTGTATPRRSGNVFDVSMTFRGGRCVNGTSTLPGIVYLEGGSLYGAVLDTTRSQGVLVTATKVLNTVSAPTTAPPSVSIPSTGSSSGSSITTGNSSGCGSRGGPGYRKANGQCASWADYYAGRR